MKQKEIKILSDDELNDKLSLFSSSLYETKTTHAVSPIENPLNIRKIRRTIARLKTEISKRVQK
jgi:large subunit ribosomal protein L29